MKETGSLSDTPFSGGNVAIGNEGFSSLSQSTIIFDTRILVFHFWFIDSYHFYSSIISALFAPECYRQLIIASNADCTKIYENDWVNITVNENLCNSINSSLIISNYTCLEYILIKKTSFMNVASVVISNNPKLIEIRTEGITVLSSDNYWSGVFLYTNSVTLSSIIFYHSFIRSSFSYITDTWNWYFLGYKISYFFKYYH